MRKSGFTLIELLVVMLVIGILAVIAIPRFGDTRDRAYVSAMQADLSQVRTAQERYYQENGFVYAGDITDLTGASLFVGTDGVTVVINNADATTWDATATHASTGVECDYDAAAGTTDCS